MRAALLVSGSCLFALVACGGFGASAPLADGGIGFDGGADGAVSPDGGATGCPSLFCASFDNADWQSAWDFTKAGGGLDRVADSSATSQPYALRLLLQRSDPPKWISFALPTGFARLHAEAQMMVRQQGSGEVDLFTIGTDTETPDGIPIAATISQTIGAATPDFKMEVSTAVGPTTAPLSVTFAQWTKVEITLTRNPKPSVEVRVGGVPLVADNPNPELFTRPLRLAVGATWAQAVLDPWDVLFDDVIVDVTK